MKVHWMAKPVLTLALLFLMGVASAEPILVDPTASGSSVSISLDGDGCSYCWISTSISSSLNSAQAMLDFGESFAFDFFDITVGGLGGSYVTAYAELAFLIPDLAATATGQGSFATFFGIISGGSLVWNQPGLIDLGDGSGLQVRFENLYEFGFGNTTTVSAYVSRTAAGVTTPTSVPEPGTLALLGIGLLGLGLARRKRAA